MAVTDTLRDVMASLYDRASSLLSAPPAASGVTAYTVYGEVQLRQVQTKTLTPIRPCVFLVDAPIRPAEIALPMVAVEAVITLNPFELGNESGVKFDCTLHCFGRQRNEASLLAYLLAKNFRPLTIYNYGAPSSPTVRETAILEPKIEISRGPTPTDAQRQEGAFDHWFMVSFRGQCRDV